MFGLVTASPKELTQEEKARYGAVYCGICREIKHSDGQACRLGLQYDMAFLALLLMSLYEPEESGGDRSCILHPIKKHPWMTNEYICYAARMNVALAAYKAKDDWEDEKKLSAKVMNSVFGKNLDDISQQFPRQCESMATCIRQLNALEKENCANPDEPANCFGRLMSDLMVYKEDMWSDSLRKLGFHLGRFIYLADAAIDYEKDQKQGKYNPFIAMGSGEDYTHWEQYLVLAMAGCTDAYERLPLVQDKHLLDNILYSGVWLNYRKQQRKCEKEDHNG